MHLLITGICGFVGSTLAEALLDHSAPGTIFITGIDNFSRNGSWLNRDRLAARGIRIVHGDIRNPSDIESIGPFDFVIDAAANPSVLAGIDGKSSSRQLVEHNLGGTLNLLEACKAWKAGFILLSTSRVYSIPPLASLEVQVRDRSYHPVFVNQGTGHRGQETGDSNQEPGTKNQELSSSSSLLTDQCSLGPSSISTSSISALGITESFSTAPPVSLYGSTKITSELLALEYGLTFDFPVWINRCGVMAGARQFGKPDQGIFAFWIHSWREGRPLKYIGFDGLGHQVRDCLHPRDLAPLLLKQIAASNSGTGDRGQGTEDREQGTVGMNQERGTKNKELSSSSSRLPSPASRPQIINLSGGVKSAMSLRQLSDWCNDRFPSSPTASSLPPVSRPLSPEVRPFDLPWVVLDHSLASETWDWQPTTPIESILEEIAAFADQNPDWIAISA